MNKKTYLVTVDDYELMGHFPKITITAGSLEEAERRANEIVDSGEFGFPIKEVIVEEMTPEEVVKRLSR